MKAYTFSEAREKFATVLDEAERDGAVEIRRRDGSVFRIVPASRTHTSPLDVRSVRVAMTTDELLALVREGRERP